MTDGEARITFANRRIGEMLGWTPEEMFGRPVYDFMDRRWARVARGRMRSEAAGRGAPTQCDAKYVRRDGSDVWAIVTRTPIFDEEGRYSGLLAMVTDVTERRRLEMEVLEAGETERRRIGQDLHDTLGQSLAALTLMLKLLGDRLEASASEEAADARKIGEIAQDAARQSRAIARRLWSAVAHKPTGLAEALGSLAEETSEAFGIRCALNVDGDVSLSDYAASSQAYLVAREAVSNAIKHGQARDVRIALLRRGGVLLLTITDDGDGLAPGFERAAGLGLRSMRYRASMIGASLDIRPAPGRGAVVSCSIPAPLAE
jgi:PAS domain S-box-containing protein